MAGLNDALSRALGSFIQPVAKPADHVQDPNLSVGGKNHVQQNFTLHPKLASFRVYTGVRLALNRDRRGGAL